MQYYHSKIVNTNFEDTIQNIINELKVEGFGVLTEIDIKATLKKKIDVDFRNYKILGACNPEYAHQALLTEDKVGTMLPCNVIVQEFPDRKVEVAAVSPKASMMAIENETLEGYAAEVDEKLKKVIGKL